MTPSVTCFATALKRRTLLKGAAATGGTMAFPFVHAQEKITLRYLGTAVNQDKAIAEKFEADTGIKIQYVAVNTDEVTKRAVTSPKRAAKSPVSSLIASRPFQPFSAASALCGSSEVW